MGITTVGIVGAGQMGSRICRMLQGKHQVVVWDRNADKIERFQHDGVKFEILLEKLRGVDLIVECVKEDFNVKQQIISQLSAILFQSQTIVATNTSCLSIDRLAKCFWNPALFLGMHFMNPPDKMALVELIKGRQTSEETIQAAKFFLNSLGKEPIVVGDTPGFVVNRLLLAYLREALAMLDKGIATEQQIDFAMRKGAGMPLGPFQLADLIGLDVLCDGLSTLSDGKTEIPPILLDKVRNGNLGRKSGTGFYQYVKLKNC